MRTDTASACTACRVLAWLAALLVAGPAAWGQAGAEPEDEKFPVTVEWGMPGEAAFDRSLPGFRFGPVRVALGPVDRAVSGQVTIAYDHDATQPVVHVLPFSTTPGQQTFVETCAAVPVGLRRATVTVRSSSGPVLRQLIYSDEPDGTGNAPNAVLGAPPRFVTLGVDPLGYRDPSDVLSLNNQPQDWSRNRDEYTFERSWLAAVTHNVEASPTIPGALSLPYSWAGYEAVTAVVTRADRLSMIEPGQADALARWVALGGVLVLLADGPGDEWRLAPLPRPLDGYVSLDPVGQVQTPEVPSPFGGSRSSRASEAVPSASVMGRVVRLGPAAVSEGWRVRWAPGGGGEAEAGDGSAGLLAEGPIGLGRVMVLGADPDEFARQGDDEATELARNTAWAEALGSLAHQSEDSKMGGQPFGWSGQSQDTGLESQAVVEAIDRVLAARPVGAGPFGVIAGAFVVLGLLVSVIDPIVLKRLKLRHRAWLSGLCWIAAFSVAMAAVPRVLRDDRADFGRFGATDVVLDPANPAGPPLAAARSAVTTILTGGGSVVTLGEQPAGAWVRGVTPLGYHYNTYQRGTLPALRMVRSVLPSEAGPVPTALLGPTRVDAGERPEATVPQGVWTLRTVAELDPLLDARSGRLPTASVALRVRTGGTTDGPGAASDNDELAPALTVRGIPEGWSPTVVLETDRGRFVPEEDVWAAGETTGEMTPVFLARADPEGLRPPRGSRRGGTDGFRYMSIETSEVHQEGGIVANLPGARRRTGSIDMRLRADSDSTRWAVLELTLEQNASTPGEPGDSENEITGDRRLSPPPPPWDWFDPASPGAGSVRTQRTETFRIAFAISPEVAEALNNMPMTRRE